MSKTALEMHLTIDRRQMRARAMTAEIIRAMRPYLNTDNRRALEEAHYAVYELMMQKGVEVITDDDRRAAGLQPRNEEGWTDAELHALEYARLTVMIPMQYRAPLTHPLHTDPSHPSPDHSELPGGSGG